jgi:integrase
MARRWPRTSRKHGPVRHVNYVLKPATIDNAKPREKAFALTDGGGLLLEILPSGSKVWRFKYHLSGKREKVTIGAYPAFGIKAARDRHEELRGLVEHGESPARAKQIQAAARKVADAKAISFRMFAQQWVDETLFYRSEGYRAQIVRWLDSYVYPEIGDMRLGDVQPANVISIVKKRTETAVTAERIRTIIQQVFNHAIRKLLVTTNPATPMRGVVKRPPVQNHVHLNERQLAAFWRALDKQGAHATTIAATRLLFLTMARKNELLRSTWSEFDLAIGQWDVPAGRMKAGRAHRVYLSHQVVELLLLVKQLTGHGDYVFPSIFRGGVPMGDVTLNHFFKRIDFGVPDFSPYGTRGTSATLLREHGFAKDVVELLLAHSEKDTTAAACSHHELAAERKRALQFLADRIDKLAAGADVIEFKAA